MWYAECLYALRACLVKVRVRMVSYAVSYETAVSERPFRCPVDPFAFVPARPKGPGKATHPLLARCFRRHLLLRLKKWLPLATFAPRLPSLVYRLLSLQKVPIEWTVAPYPHSPACGREGEGRQRSPTDGSSHGLPKCQDRLKESAHPSGYNAHTRTSKAGSATF